MNVIKNGKFSGILYENLIDYITSKEGYELIESLINKKKKELVRQKKSKFTDNNKPIVSEVESSDPDINDKIDNCIENVPLELKKTVSDIESILDYKIACNENFNQNEFEKNSDYHKVDGELAKRIKFSCIEQITNDKLNDEFSELNNKSKKQSIENKLSENDFPSNGPTENDLTNISTLKEISTPRILSANHDKSESKLSEGNVISSNVSNYDEIKKDLSESNFLKIETSGLVQSLDHNFETSKDHEIVFDEKVSDSYPDYVNFSINEKFDDNYFELKMDAKINNLYNILGPNWINSNLPPYHADVLKLIEAVQNINETYDYMFFNEFELFFVKDSLRLNPHISETIWKRINRNESSDKIFKSQIIDFIKVKYLGFGKNYLNWNLFNIFSISNQLENNTNFNMKLMSQMKIFPSDIKPFVYELFSKNIELKFLENHNYHFEEVVNLSVSKLFFYIGGFEQCINYTQFVRNQISNHVNVFSEEKSEYLEIVLYEQYFVISNTFSSLKDNKTKVLSAKDFEKYDNYGLSQITLTRIFEEKNFGIVEENDTISFEGFAKFFMLDIDKWSNLSLIYWFCILDLDADGYISILELEDFLSEQIIRIEARIGEILSFDATCCQIADMFQKKNSEIRLTLGDLMQNREHAVYLINLLTNVTKFIQSDENDAILDNNIKLPHLDLFENYCHQQYSKLLPEFQNQNVN